MKYDVNDIAKAIGNRAYFNRGVGYFNDKMVLSIGTNASGTIFAKVAGSSRHRYDVSVTINKDTSGKIRSINGRCSCPIGYNCKHVAAVLLEARSKELARSAKSEDPALPADLDIWLKDLSVSRNEKEEVPRSGTKQTRMFYVFRQNDFGYPAIIPYKGYVKKDGEIGKNVSRFEVSTGSFYSNDQTLDDVLALSQLRYFTRHGQLPRWPQGEELNSFLQLIVSTGRARAISINGPQLIWSGQRIVSLQWEGDDAGNQKLLTKDVSNKPLELIPFPDAVYIDRSTGEIGFAQTDLPAATVSILARAPIVKPEHVPDVAKALAERDLTLPSPRAVQIRERSDLPPRAHITLYACKDAGYHLFTPQGARSLSFGENVYPCIRMGILYGQSPKTVPPGLHGTIRVRDDEGLTIIHRDYKAEKALLKRLKMNGDDFDGFHPLDIDDYGRLPNELEKADVIFPPILPGGNLITNPALGFTSQVLPELRRAGWEVEIDPNWPFHLHEGEFGFHTAFEHSDVPSGSGSGSENDWFSLALKLELDGLELNLTPTIQQIIESLPLDEYGDLHEGFDIGFFLSELELYPQLSDGRFVPIPGERLAGFVEAFLETNGFTNFHMAEAARVTAIAEALDGCGAPWKGGKEILKLGKSLQALNEREEIEPPSPLTADLRPYQRIGYGWLKALNDSSYGGILADDMGLGKTIQTLALLVQRHLVEKTDKPSLLIIPTSLIGNWQNEVSRFAPDLKLLTLHGPDRRDRFGEIPDHHLVMTTYPLANRDHELLFAHGYDLAILDEAQAVKNPSSNIAKRIRDIKARQRIALTGTPLENNLTELWSIYDWLIPGLLGDRKKFGTDYRTPIERHGNRARQRQLSTRLKPFLLRRTKDEVAKDLPPKTVIDEVVTLGGKQAALYESVRTAMDKRVRDAIKAKGLAGSHITVLDALLKLRQVCCDPSLVKLDAAAKVKESAKRERLMEILTELVGEGRHVLVFSQFVEMLRLIEADIKAAGWDYAMLHGQTKKRAAEVERFQSGEVSIFLISLKAGGTGLNLTAADTVVIFDPWWNPAVERQAMDRAHRIGQDKPVFVHRLLADNTVEIAIQTMQAHKQALADSLFEGTSGGPMALTEDDLSELFRAR